MSMFDEVTRQIKAQLEAGTRPWIKPWNGGGSPMPLRFNGEMYQGINVILLWLQNRTAPTWMTYRQASEIGGQVRKGEKGTAVCYSAPVTNKDDETYRVYKWYKVFNADQIDDLPQSFAPPVIKEFANPDQRSIDADHLIACMPADVRHNEPRAYFNTGVDYINMPEWGTFRSGLDYYSTLFHELVHWTGHESRLDRKFSSNKNDYAIEELVAEMGSAFLMAQLGLEAQVRDDHASYIKHWLNALNNDSKFIFSAAAAASKAVNYIWQTQTAKQEAA